MNKILLKSDPFALKFLKTILATCLVLPVLTWSGVIFPYTVPKVFAFRILVELAAVFYFYLALKYPAYFYVKKICHPELARPAEALCEGRVLGSQNNRSRNKTCLELVSGFGMTIIVGAVLIFLLANVLSAFSGIDFSTSFWGNLERGMGVFGLLHFAAWFIILSSVLNFDRVTKETKEDEISRFRGGRAPLRDGFFYQLIKVSVFASAIISLLAICQHFFSLGDLLPQVDRVYSLIGNAGVLGSYLIFNIFLAGYLFFESRDKTRWLFAICYLLFAICLLLTGTRGAWLGLAGGLTMFALLVIFVKREKSPLAPPKGGELNSLLPPFREGWGGFRGLAAVILISIFILLGVIFLARNTTFIKTNSVLSRLTSISFSDTTVQSRLILWQDSWRAWQGRPFLGFGPENFEQALGPYLSPRLSQFENYSLDRAHNFIFDYGVNLGWLGLFSYLAMLGVVVGRLWQKRRQDFIFSAIFISSLVAYLVQSFFIFDSFVSYLMLFFVLALIGSDCQNNLSLSVSASSVIPAPRPSVAAGERGQAGIQNPGSRIKSGMTAKMDITKKIILLFVIGNLSFVIYVYSLKPFLAAHRANQILSLSAGEADQAEQLLKNVLDLKTFASGEIVYQTTIDYIEKINQNPALMQNENFYALASSELKRAIENSPSQPLNYIVLSWLDLYFSDTDKVRLEEARVLAQKATELSPSRSDAYLPLVAAFVLSGRTQEAEQVIDRAGAVDVKMGEEVKLYLERLN